LPYNLTRATVREEEFAAGKQKYYKASAVTVELTNVKITYNKAVYFQREGQIFVCHDIPS
jgi:hypothetical protein